MKKFFVTLLSLICIIGCLCLSACVNNEIKNGGTQTPADTEIRQENELPLDKTDVKDTDMYIKIGDTVLTATLVDNSSTRALKKLLPITIQMNDYGNFEKVGSLNTTLPRNDENISTDAGDLILYQGNSFVIYYDRNNWNFTRLGKINNVGKEELKSILGSGSVTVTLTLEK